MAVAGASSPAPGIWRLFAAAAALVLGCGWNAASFATAYPDRPIRLVVPAAPGGAIDVVGRIVA
jgi:tripartite-type tricarboxylate transporter receptor subunit TctC